MQRVYTLSEKKGGNKCKAVFYTYKQVGMQSLELFWPCSILAKNQGDVLARGLSYQGLEAFEARPQSVFGPGLKGLEALFIIEGVIVRVISKSDEREARGRFENMRAITP